MNSKELIFLVLLTAATGFAGYTWDENRQIAPGGALATTVNPTDIPKPINPTPPKKLPVNPADQEQVGARHILIQYQGSARAKPEVTRTKDEAKALAEKLLQEAKAPGADFAALVTKYSD